MAELSVFAFSPCVETTIFCDTSSVPESTRYLLDVLEIKVLTLRHLINTLWPIIRLRLIHPLSIPLMPQLAMLRVAHSQQTAVNGDSGEVVFATADLFEGAGRFVHED